GIEVVNSERRIRYVRDPRETLNDITTALYQLLGIPESNPSPPTTVRSAAPAPYVLHPLVLYSLICSSKSSSRSKGSISSPCISAFQFGPTRVRSSCMPGSQSSSNSSRAIGTTL